VVVVVGAGWLLRDAWLQRMPLIDLVARVIGNENNGLLSRYNISTGVASGSLAYLRSHPFAPIGLADLAGSGGSLAGQFLGDSGPVQYLLRGGLLLLGAMYGGLWVFLSRTIHNRRVAVWVWGVTLAFELGFSALLVARVVALIMLSAVCLRDIYATDGKAALTRTGVSSQPHQHGNLEMQRHAR
jgi:hypothetical protein